MVPLVIFVCLLIANSSSEYVTKSKLSEEAIIENLKNNIEITSSNRTDGNSKDIFQRILLKDTLMLTKDVGEILRTSPVMIFRVASYGRTPTVRHFENGEKRSRPYSSVLFKIDDEMYWRRVRLFFTPTSFWLTGRILFYPNLAVKEV